MTQAVFLDTMIYLHYRAIQEVDWHGVLSVSSSEQIVVILPGITLRELDHHKNHTPRLKERAQRVSGQLNQALIAGHESISTNVRLEAELAAPAVDFEAFGLDKTIADDVLLAAAIAYQRDHAGTVVTVVTQDSYPAIRARGLGLRARQMADEYKLPPAEDPVDRENRSLKRKLQKLEAALPLLDLQLSNGENTLRFTRTAVEPLTEAGLAAAMAIVEKRFPSPDTFRPKPRAAGTPDARPASTGSLSRVGQGVDLSSLAAAAQAAQSIYGHTFRESDIVRYGEDRAQFLKRYADHLRVQRQLERARARRIVVDLALVNCGGAPASDIDVRIHIPDPLDVLGTDLLSHRSPPDEPELPKRRSPMSDFLISPNSFPSIDPLRHIDLNQIRGANRDRPNVSGLKITEGNSTDVSVHVQKVKHGLNVSLPTLYLTVSEDRPIVPFQILYELHAANVPDAITGCINVLVSA